MDIRTLITITIILLFSGGMLSIWVGIRSFHAKRLSTDFDLRHQLLAGDWRIFASGIFLFLLTFLLVIFAKPIGNRFFPAGQIAHFPPATTITPDNTLNQPQNLFVTISPSPSPEHTATEIYSTPPPIKPSTATITSMNQSNIIPNAANSSTSSPIKGVIHSLTKTTTPSSTPSQTSTPLWQQVTLYFTDTKEIQPYEVGITRYISSGIDPVEGVLKAYFLGTSDAERSQGLTVVLNGFTGYRRFKITNGVIHVYLSGTCQSNGTSYSIAQPLMANLKQFPEITYVKLYDQNGVTRDPVSLSDSAPICLDPSPTPNPTSTLPPSRTPTPTFTSSPTATSTLTHTTITNPTYTHTPTRTPSQTPTLTSTPLWQQVTLYFTDTKEIQPYEVGITRYISSGIDPVEGVLKAYFSGISEAERSQGLTVVLNGFTGYKRIKIANGVIHVYLSGTCQSNGTSYNIAQPLMANLKQFLEISYVKIYDQNGFTRDPVSHSDSAPICLDPSPTPNPTSTLPPSRTPTPTFTSSPTATSTLTHTTITNPTYTHTPTRTPSQTPTLTSTPLWQQVTLYFADTKGIQPYEVGITRYISSGIDPVEGVLKAYFLGTSDAERSQGLTVVLNGFTGYKRIKIANGVIHVYLSGTCQSNGTSYSIAQPLMANLKQFLEITYVKLYDQNGVTRDPVSLSDSAPICLDPSPTLNPTSTLPPSRTPIPTRTHTSTPTLTPSFTSSPTTTSTLTRTTIPNPTYTHTPTRTPSQTPRSTLTQTSTRTPTRTSTRTPSKTPTKTSLPTTTLTRTPTKTPSLTSTPTYTVTPTTTFTPSPTLTPTWTPTLIPGCDHAGFITDVTVPDNTIFSPGASFTKTWRLRNIGSCSWTPSYSLAFVSGEKMGGAELIALPRIILPGETVDLSVNLVAPGTPGINRGDWQLRNSSGRLFGISSTANQPFWVLIEVVLTPTGTTTFTPVPPSFQDYDFVANACLAQWGNAADLLPCPGREGDTKGIVQIIDRPKMENGTTATQPGLLTIPQVVENGYIQGIYPEFEVRNGDHFQSIVNCEGSASNCLVLFQLDYQDNSRQVHTFWAFGEKYEGNYFQADLDLSQLAGQKVRFILKVLSLGNAVGDRALWVGPRIVRAVILPTSTTIQNSLQTPTLTPIP